MLLKHLTDATLLKDTKFLVKEERRLTLSILFHFQEIERRKLYSDLRFPSLFEYAVSELKYSQASAQRRIEASRLLKDLPEIIGPLEREELSLTNVAAANSFFRSQKIKDPDIKRKVLKNLEGKSTRECEQILLKLLGLIVPRKDSLKQVSEDMFELNLSIHKKVKEKWDMVKNLKSHKKMSREDLLEYALDCVLEKEKKKQVVSKVVPVKVKNSRFIPKSVKIAVMKRDKGKCVQCSTRHKLQIDHVKPFSMGGTNSIQNLRVLCEPCNQRMRLRQGLVNLPLPLPRAEPS